MPPAVRWRSQDDDRKHDLDAHVGPNAWDFAQLIHSDENHGDRANLWITFPLSSAMNLSSTTSDRAAAAVRPLRSIVASALNGRQSYLWLVLWAGPSSSCVQTHLGACRTNIFALQWPQMWRERLSMQCRERRIKVLGREQSQPSSYFVLHSHPLTNHVEQSAIRYKPEPATSSPRWITESTAANVSICALITFKILSVLTYNE